MNLSNKLWTAFENKTWFRPGVPILLAVSGGKDSMALLHCCYEKKLTIAVATVNYNLRGKESTKEANLVLKWCKKRKIPHFLYTVPNDYWETKKGNFQELARELRYQWFQEIMTKHGFQYLFTAHHGSDQIETVTQFFLRGTGLQGMGGMLLEQKNHVRPLLICTSHEIESYVSHNKVPYLNDSSNNEDKYNRNKIRHKVMPAFKQIDSNFENKALITIQNLQNSTALLNTFIEVFKKTHYHYFQGGFSVETKLLTQIPPLSTLLFHLFQDLNLNETHIHDLVQIIEKPKEGAFIQNNNHKIVYSRGVLYQLQLQIEQQPNEIAALPATCSFGIYSFEFKLLSAKACKHEPNQLILDASNVKFPIRLTTPVKGEKFTPFGLNHRKLVSDFLTDRKTNPAQKQSVLMLKDAKQKTLALLPLEIDQAYSVKKGCEKVICIKIKKAGT